MSRLAWPPCRTPRWRAPEIDFIAAVPAMARADSAARADFDPAVEQEALVPLVAVEAELARVLVAAARSRAGAGPGPAAGGEQRHWGRIGALPDLPAHPGRRRSRDRCAGRNAPCAASRESAVACRSRSSSCPDRTSQPRGFARFPDCL